MRLKTKTFLLGLSILASTALLNAAEDWRNHTALYMLEVDEGTFINKSADIRDSDSLSGTSDSTEETFNRSSGKWVKDDHHDLLLSTATGDWEKRPSSYPFQIMGDDHEILEVIDGYARLDNVIDISGETIPFSACFNTPVTFSNGAKFFSISWKQKEYYSLQWSPQDWNTDTPSDYSSLENFVASDNPFLHNETNGENAGFRVNAQLSDGSGDLVVVKWGSTGRTDGRVIGHWDASYTLPGQNSTSIRFDFTDKGFLGGDHADFMFASMYDSKVWIGQHTPASTTWENIGRQEGFYLGNEIGENDYLAAMAPYDFSKLVNCDILDKKFDIMTEQQKHLQTSFYGNMNFITALEVAPNQWQTLREGTWSVENGALIGDSIKNDLDKTTTVIQMGLPSFNMSKAEITFTGRGELKTHSVQLHVQSNLPKTNIPYKIHAANLKGKKADVTYTENNIIENGTAYFFNNMTFAYGNSGENVGVWRVENGTVVLDSYWLGGDGSTVETGTESWVFDDATHAKIYSGNTEDASIVINSLSPITSADTLPPHFDNASVPYPVTADFIAGHKVLVGDTADPLNQDTFYFYGNMTFKRETHDDDGKPQTTTGAWRVEEGAVVADIIYSDQDSAHYVLTFNAIPAPGSTFTFMEVVGKSAAQGKETKKYENVPIVSITTIPSGNKGAGIPAVVMYLLN